MSGILTMGEMPQAAIAETASCIAPSVGCWKMKIKMAVEGRTVYVSMLAVYEDPVYAASCNLARDVGSWESLPVSECRLAGIEDVEEVICLLHRHFDGA